MKCDHCGVKVTGRPVVDSTLGCYCSWHCHDEAHLAIYDEFGGDKEAARKRLKEKRR